MPENTTNPWCNLRTTGSYRQCLHVWGDLLPGQGGKCVPQTICECVGDDPNAAHPYWSCGSNEAGILLCPEVCPEILPTSTEGCGIAVQYQCGYGNVCNTTVPGPSVDYEIKCHCDAGTFSCNNRACPSVPCPITQPTPGDSCSALFDGTCSYGELCCPGEGGKCVANRTTCYCEYDSTIQCEDNLAAILPCPSVCPEVAPMENDPCDIDFLYLCGYGDPVVCNDSSYSSEYEKDCQCLDGHFTCSSHRCPVPCPKSPLVEGAPCSHFAGTSCDSGKFCCPEEGGKCIPEKKCLCGSTIYCLDLSTNPFAEMLPCPSVCPKTPPATGDACDIDVRFDCVYGDAFVCEGTINSFEHERECYCSEGKFSCTTNVCTTPLPCPKTPVVEGDACSGEFQYNGPFYSFECAYGEICCPGEGGKCLPDQLCYCAGERISCQIATYYASLPCPSVCPSTPPKTNDPCDIDSRYECRYGGPLPCNNMGWSMYNTQCYCYNGTFSCESNSCPPVGCPETQPVHGAACSPFVGGTCNYIKQPCCIGGDGVSCVANSTCSCDDLDYTVKCVELPIVSCPTNGILNSTGSTGGQMNGNKKVRKPKKIKKKKKKIKIVAANGA